MNELRLALQYLKVNKKYSIFFITTLALGLAGLLTLTLFAQNLEKQLQTKSRELLGGDFLISARRVFEEGEIKSIEEKFTFSEKSKTIRLFTMASGENLTKLIRLKGIEKNYPLTGVIEFEDELDNQRFASNAIWVYPEVIYQFKVKLGDYLEIANKKFKITKVIKRDSTDGAGGFSLAPIIYIDLKTMDKLGLTGKLSTLWENHFYVTDIRPKELKEDLSKQISDYTIRLTTPSEASEQVQTALSRITQFLVFVTLVSLFLSLIGVNYLFKSYLTRRSKDFALYNCLGLYKNQVRRIFILEVLTLSSLSSFLSIGLSMVLLPWLIGIMEKASGLQLSSEVSNYSILISFLIGLIGPLICSLPSLIELSKIKTISLLNKSPIKLSPLIYLSSFVPLIIFLFVMAVFLSRSFLIGSIFTGSLITSFMILILVSLLFLKIIQRKFFKFSPWRFALRNIKREQLGSISIIIAIGIGSLLVNLIPQIKTSIEYELSGPDRSKLPSLFLFDIQSHQVKGIKELTKKFNNELADISPLIRARLLQLNGEEYERDIESQEFTTQEDQRNQRFRNRGLNLSYAFDGKVQHDIVKGKPFSGRYDWDENAPLEISLEKRYANRMDLKVGDKLTLDIQGIEMPGIVVNTRNVDWLSFKPNFFVEVQPGAIDEAPKSLIGVLYEKNIQIQNELQYELAKNFPTVSVINLNRVIKEILRVMDQLQSLVSVTAVLAIIVGLFVLFAVTNYEAKKYIPEINLLKVLGAPFPTILKITLYQYLTLSIFASLGGILLSLATSFFISIYIFENQWVFDPATPVISFILIIVFTIGTLLASSYKTFRTSPATLLNSSSEDI